MQVEETLRKGSAEKNPNESRRAGAEGKRAAQNEARTATAHTRQAAHLTTPLWSRCMAVLASERGKISLESHTSQKRRIRLQRQSPGSAAAISGCSVRLETDNAAWMLCGGLQAKEEGKRRTILVKHPFAFQVAHFYVSVDIRLGIKRHLVRGGCRIGGVIPETRIEVWKERWREKSI